MEKFVINIGRQLGSGGRAVGHILARELGIAYFDKEILTLAASESGFSEELFVHSDEHKGFLRGMVSNLIPFLGAGNDFYTNTLSEENLFRIQSIHQCRGCCVICVQPIYINSRADSYKHRGSHHIFSPDFHK